MQGCASRRSHAHGETTVEGFLAHRMKQVTQRLRDGRIEVLDVPVPELSDAGVLVDVRRSVLSVGTERAKVESGRLGLFGKARARPDQVRAVLEKARRDGIAETVGAVRLRLDAPSPLGYSAAGVVLAVGPRVRDLVAGDRVACAGAHYAVHAEIDHVPANLCVRLPDGVEFDEGAFATIGAIALQGVRQAGVSIGERVAVIGLGLVGQLTGQILRAAGCSVVGVDLSRDLVDRALRDGAADEAVVRGEIQAEQSGCDAAVVTAAAASNDPVELAAELCRDRGRVVVVGLVGMELPRARFYEKELDLRLSRSYGPGRYDREYEERGLDYPIGYVRWTERRNLAAFLDLVAAGKVDVRSLITERVSLTEAPAAYERLLAAQQSPLGVILEYAPTAPPAPVAPVVHAPRRHTLATGVIGPGSFAQRVLIPSLREAGFEIVALASGSGLSARSAADALGIDAVLRPDEIVTGSELGVVVIATRHSTHAPLAGAALRAGKAVFVEKPPCLTWDELADLRAARAESDRPLAVGFNRRHAPLARRLRDHVRTTSEPIELLYRVNAGRLEPGHWLNDLDEGGGRLLGEGCHFVDFACWVVGEVPALVTCLMAPRPGQSLAAAESFTIALEFVEGSVASILYSSRGSPRLGKERVEAHAGGRSAVLDDFHRLELLDGRRQVVRSRRGDKGHRAQLAVFRRVVEGEAPEPPDPLATMAATLATVESAQLGHTVRLNGGG
jgi:predicted dehydrogenase/threonine dehydrogenase-like Zn-dependent dehydrogenase